MNNFFRSRILGALLLLLFVFLAGVLGFVIIYDFTWVDAIYMTIITITTVGFGEVHPLSPSEKIFTSILIVSSIFIVGYAIKEVSEYMLSKNNIGNLRKKRVQSKINSLQNHIIVCGYGRNGRQAAQKLQAYNKPYVVIEKDEDVIERSLDDKVLFVHGNADEDETLYRAGIDRAATLICALPSDADNLFVVLSARQIKSDLRIISRAHEETSYKKLKLAGADNVIMPDRIGGDHMASLVVVPDLVEFLDNLTVSGEQDSINVEQIAFENVCADGREMAISELDLRKKTGCSIIGYKSPEGEYIVNPEPTTVVKKDSKLIVIGRPNQIEGLKQLYNV
ncbi:potassium channel protein [Aureisphaera galaxeae]|uniref:potassium channel family protein n=1 Tax=Aureisphaera galaxeae TaxID=1538023 RepID=UPI002351006D|nr:potassium channel protein [Aureisphaera galaxeae]MDC8004483.1 potassium channel protein [Aureisphaera galaxeae]